MSTSYEQKNKKKMIKILKMFSGICKNIINEIITTGEMRCSQEIRFFLSYILP